MTFKGITGIDYNEEKARIDASGFDACHEIFRNCQVCGQEMLRNGDSDVCEKCQKE